MFQLWKKEGCIRVLFCNKRAGGQAYRVIYPTNSMSNVVLILPFEYQSPVTVVLLGWPIQLPIHIRAMKDHSVLVGVDSLALQGIINVVPFQGAGKKKENSGRLFPNPRRRHDTALRLTLSFHQGAVCVHRPLHLNCPAELLL